MLTVWAPRFGVSDTGGGADYTRVGAAAGNRRLRRSDLALALCLACLSGLTMTPGLAAAEPKAVVQGQMDGDLKAEIARAVGEIKTPAPSRLDARRRARDAASAAVALLRSEGYYEGDVQPDVSEGEPPKAVINVTTGPRFLIADPTITWTGDTPPPLIVRAAADAIQLKPGAPGRAPDVVAAEGRIVAALHARGYADAATEPRKVVVDYADHTVRPAYAIDAGELVRLGQPRIETKGRTNVAFAKSLATWKPGQVYDPLLFASLERRLIDTGVYESVTVALAPKPRIENGLRPVVITLVDRPPRTIELGAVYSTTQGELDNYLTTDSLGFFGAYSTTGGSGLDGKWIHYNVFGRADTLTLTGQLYNIEQLLDLGVAFPDWKRPDQILKLDVGGINQQTPAYSDTGGGVRVEVERHWTKTTFVTVGAAVDYGFTTEEEPGATPEAPPINEKLDLFVTTLLAGYNLDKSNDILNPTKGWRFTIQAAPTWLNGDRKDVYVKTQAQTTGYLPLASGGRTVLAGRLEVGSILGGGVPEVPTQQRFFSGGGGSVRGYSYQGVGPRLSDNTPEGGVSLVEVSAEVRQQVAKRWGVVAFVDAGSVGLTTTPDFAGLKNGIGAGVGVRYDFGFGPLRLDVATPVTARHGDPAVQVYISIGQAF